MSTIEEKREGFYLSEDGKWIPVGWRKSKISNYLKTPSSATVGVMYPGEHKDDGVPLVRVGDVTDGRITAAPSFKISDEVDSKYSKTRLEGNELIVTLVGEPGECVVANEKMKGWNVARALAVVRFHDQSIREWIRYSLKTRDCIHQVEGFLNTTVQKTLNLKELKVVEFLDPPSSERTQVVKLLQSFEDKIELLREQNETLETLAQILFKQWFIDFNFPDENGNPYKDSGGKMIPSELGEIPEGWKTDKIDEYISISGGGTPSTKEPDYWDGNIAWSSPKDLSDRPDVYLFKTNKMITDQGLKSISSNLNPIGSLLLSSRAPIGYVALNDIPVAVNQGYIVFAPHQYFSNQFMFLWLKKYMHLVNNAANGSTFLEISKKAFKEIETIIPDQTALSTFQNLIEPVFDKLRSNLKQIQTLTQLRDTLLPKLMKGEIRVPVET